MPDLPPDDTAPGDDPQVQAADEAVGTAGVPARVETPPPPARIRRKPVWRRIVVGFFVWLFGLGLGFAALSALAVLVIGRTGPPPTLNMAIKASSGVEVRKTWAPLSEISPHLIRAVIAAEDQRFCTHDGFDRVEIQKAIDAAERGRRLRGASTISQQTAKNVFLWNGGGWVRKGFEVWFTVLAEQMWSKPRIMEIYLNVAEWGDGLYGAEAAAQARFKKSAKDLTSREAALLAAVLPSPNRWKITGSYANRRAGNIQTLMRMVRRDDLDSCVIR